MVECPGRSDCEELERRFARQARQPIKGPSGRRPDLTASPMIRLVDSTASVALRTASVASANIVGASGPDASPSPAIYASHENSLPLIPRPKRCSLQPGRSARRCRAIRRLKWGATPPSAPAWPHAPPTAATRNRADQVPGHRSNRAATRCDQINRLPLVVVRKRPTLTFFHPTPPGSLSLLQVSVNSGEVQDEHTNALVTAPSCNFGSWNRTSG